MDERRMPEDLRPIYDQATGELAAAKTLQTPEYQLTYTRWIVKLCERAMLTAEIVKYAGDFCDETEGEMQDLEGSESNSLPANFVLLQRAIKNYRQHNGEEKTDC